MFTSPRCVVSVTSLLCGSLHTFLVCWLEAGELLLLDLQHAARGLHVFHVVGVSADDRKRQVWSCGRTCRLFILVACEEILLPPGSAHKIIWAFQGLTESRTAYASILDYNSLEQVTYLVEISRDYL